MQLNLIVIDKPDKVADLIKYVQDFEYVAYDCETTGVNQGTEVIGYSICCEEDKAFYVILQKWDVKTYALAHTGCLEKSKELVASLKNKKLIMHNAIFDCRVAEDYFKIRLIDSVHTDTMVLAHLLDETRRIGLKELGKELFGEDAAEEQRLMKESVAANKGSLTKQSYEMYKADAYLMAKYGAKDAWLTYKLFLEMVPELIGKKLDKFFYDEESMPLLRTTTYDMNKIGLKIDLRSVLKLKTELIAECEQDKAYINEQINHLVKEKYPGTNKKNTFNFTSNSQLSWLLFGQLNLKFLSLTNSGKNACAILLGKNMVYTKSKQEEFIAKCEAAENKKLNNPFKFIKTDIATLTELQNNQPWLKRLLSYKKKQKMLTTYLKPIETKAQYGVIYPSFLQTGTTSGRYSSRNPNFQNLPRDDKSIKSCVVARPGKVFVGADYSQLEPRVFAYFSQDKNLMDSFSSEDDFYSVIGMKVWDKTDCIPRKDGSPDAFGIKYKNLRNLAKVIALASTYGATPARLSSTTGKSIDETKQDIDSYFSKFPGVKQMMLDAHEEVKSKGVVYNLFGRPRNIPEALKIYPNAEHSELDYKERSYLNLSVNHRIQSTAASIVNRASIMFYKKCKESNINANIVLQVHDSLIVECLEANAYDVSLLLRDSMEHAVELPGVKLEAVPQIGKNLAEV